MGADQLGGRGAWGASAAVGQGQATTSSSTPAPHTTASKLQSQQEGHLSQQE